MIYAKVNYKTVKSVDINVVHIQIKIPHTVGKINARAVHFQLPVSFLIESKVVPQGKCKTMKIITLMAVRRVHPF